MFMVCTNLLYLLGGDIALGTLIIYNIVHRHHGFLVLCIIIAIVFNAWMIYGLVTLDTARC